MMQLFNGELAQAEKLDRFKAESAEKNAGSQASAFLRDVVDGTHSAQGGRKRVVLSRREQLRKKFDLKSEPANIFMCWLLMWCGTFKYQEKNEREFLAF